jgi:hypothetical protein
MSNEDEGDGKEAGDHVQKEDEDEDVNEDEVEDEDDNNDNNEDEDEEEDDKVDEDESYPPENKHDDEPMAEAEIPVSDEVLDGDGDGEEASQERGETGLEETKHKKTNELKNMETLKFQGNIPTKN